eukprot:358752-Chlamydomonas_euryale.AAC.20
MSKQACGRVETESPARQQRIIWKWHKYLRSNSTGVRAMAPKLSKPHAQARQAWDALHNKHCTCADFVHVALPSSTSATAAMGICTDRPAVATVGPSSMTASAHR